MQSIGRFINYVLCHPLVWGGLAALTFYSLIHSDAVQNEFIQRYFASHPVEYVITTMFFVGIAALVIKGIELIVQQLGMRRPNFDATPSLLDDALDAEEIYEEFSTLPAWCRNTYLGKRLHEAIDFVRRKKSAAGLDEQLRYLADTDTVRVQESYALARIVIWAIPVLGFLGTVIGITLAIAELSPDQLENSLPAVTKGLGVAFDTTALALALSIVLMFVKHFLEKQDARLLVAVDERVAHLLAGRFQQPNTTSDANVAAVRGMAETVVQATESLVQRQSELWRSTVEEAHQHWSQLTNATGRELSTALSAALGDALARHATVLTESEQHMAHENWQKWADVQKHLVECTRAMVEQQSELVHQGEVLRQVVEATGQIKRLEMALNDNLQSLAGAHHFEETVMSLAAAIQLLSARLGAEPTDLGRVELPSVKSIGSAA